MGMYAFHHYFIATLPYNGEKFSEFSHFEHLAKKSLVNE